MKYWGILLFLFIHPLVWSEEKVLNDLMNLSLDELLKVQSIMPGAITKGSIAETPASLTSLSALEIENTPARNILDLIEIYVPGAIWLNYEEGPIIGMRGSIVNGNYKYLLILNGRVLNNKSLRGAQSELEQWNLSDIEKIDIIRSPGSVTYGPGAVAGVISITTKNASDELGGHIQAKYLTNYDSKGLALNYGYEKKNFDVFTHLSATKTSGYQARHFVGSNGGGYIGEDINTGDVPTDYFTDYQNRPQIKFFTDMNFNKGWSAWLRYTQQGSTWKGNEVKSDFNGKLHNQAAIDVKQATLSLEKSHDFSKDESLITKLSFDSLDTERRRDGARNPDPGHAQNKKVNYSENEILFNSIYLFKPRSWAEVALGVEYSFETFGKGWGDNQDDFITGGDGEMISDLNSNALGPRLSTNEAIFIGDGWETHSYAAFTEANFKVNEKLKFLISSRLDKSTYSNYLFSPRLSAIKKIDKTQSLRFITQRSFRRNTSSHEFLEDRQGKGPSEESLDSYEIIYTNHLKRNILLNVSSFYNDAEVFAFDSNIDETALIGELKTYGLEIELEQQSNTSSWGMNYSFTKQLEFELSPGIIASGISYSDYDQDIGSEGAIINGYGNDLNNWPNQALKLHFTKNFSHKFSFHINHQFFWDYQGGKDGLKALEQAVAGTSDEASANAAIDRVRDEKAFELNFRTNLSLSYQTDSSGKWSFSILNLFGSNYSKRYSYDSGTSKTEPHKVRFVEEERAFGIQFDHKW